MVASVVLKQEKYVLSTSFRVWSTITEATPDELFGGFVFETGLSPWEELYRRVATLEDVSRYARNELIRFTAPTIVAALPVAGDVLVIATTIDDWLHGTLGLTNQHFILGAQPALTDYVLVREEKPFPDMRTGLSWELWDETMSTLKGSGSSGYTRRAADSSTPYLTKEAVRLFTNVATAESHAIAVLNGIQNLAVASNTTPPPFPGYEEHTYPQ